MAKKIDPTKIHYAPIWDTYGDMLAKGFRDGLKKTGFKGTFLTVFSDEKPICKEMGSLMCVTASFGLTLASLAIRKITGKM